MVNPVAFANQRMVELCVQNNIHSQDFYQWLEHRHGVKDIDGSLQCMERYKIYLDAIELLEEHGPHAFLSSHDAEKMEVAHG